MEIKTDSLHKIAYATDASVYREIPYGVAYPANEDDIVALIAEARRRGTNLIARAGMQVGICEGRPDSSNSTGMGWGTFEISDEKTVKALEKKGGKK